MESNTSKVENYANASSIDATEMAKDISTRVGQSITGWSNYASTMAIDVSARTKEIDCSALKHQVPLYWGATKSIKAIFYCAMLFGTATYTSFHSGVGVQVPPRPGESSMLTVTRLEQFPENKTAAPIPGLPTCKSLMQDKDSPYHSGDFLTRKTIPVSWRPRADHSRELQHSVCQLHRYTAEEAKQCLAGKHINMIGDSLTRYQYLSLAYLLHKGSYPPRFEREWRARPCIHKDENGRPACSPKDEPNVCMEEDWIWNFDLEQDGTDAWTRFMQTMGGSRYFDGYMDSAAIRRTAAPFETIAENYFYATPPRKTQNEETSSEQKRVFLSFNEELGWNDQPTPIHGFVYKGCALYGACSYSDELVEERLKRSAEMDFDFSQPLEEAIAPDGILRHILPPVDIALYNRGLWGALDRGRAEKIFPLLHNFSQGENGRCYFRATNPHYNVPLPNEPLTIRHAAFASGCGYIDHAHLVEDFTQQVFAHPDPPGQKYGNINDERKFIYMDAVHFKPWVYEELNNMLLNILCNNA